jgi:thiol-disulfide isomerase/thioredoxin
LKKNEPFGMNSLRINGWRWMMAAVLMAGLQGSVHAARIGDPAPPLRVERWVKGNPIRIAPGTNIFVVEFWATWCPPCRKSIPHLTELQQKYGPKGVAIIGISSEKVEEVSPFVTSQGANMNYRVAVDSSGTSMKAWMDAYGQNGIPHAFIVDRQGKVAWHGFPSAELDSALEKMTEGKFDIKQAQGFENGNRAVEQYRAAVLKPKSAERAAAFGQKIVDDLATDWRVPHRLARLILTDPEVRSRDLELALKASTKAVEMTDRRSSDALEMNARALFASGKKAEAITVQKEAIEKADESDLPELKKFLAIYEKAATAAK